MKPVKDETTKPSETNKVNEYMSALNHPLKKVMEALRQIILATDTGIGEEIKWNAPAFFYMGKMKPFNPKEYKRHIVVSNLFKKDCIRLVFPSGAKLSNNAGLLEGDYADGRRLAMFRHVDEVKSKEKALQKVIEEWLNLLDK